MTRTARRALTIVIVLAVLLAALFVGTALATDRPQFCPSCHEMQPYYDAWAKGPHKDVWCVDCHVAGGVPARFEHKFVALTEVYDHVRGDIMFPRAAPPDVPDTRCFSCHPDLPGTIDGFPHAAHAEKGHCAQCHYNTGHKVTDRALQSAGVFNPTATPQRLSGKMATVGSGKANLPNHQGISCTECHNMQATPCALCHKPRGDKHPKVGKQPCIACHPATGASWKFVHPKVKGDCAECHKAPAKHPAGSCVNCHAKPGKSWAFSHPGANADCTRCHKAPAKHPSGECVSCHKSVGRSWVFAHPRRVGEHSYRNMPCKDCHPNNYAEVYCTCHKGRPPSD